MTASNSKPSIAVVDYLRGIAALGVAFFHSRVPLWIGWHGLRANAGDYPVADRMLAWLSVPTPFMGSLVMLFFVISGFCVHLPQAGRRDPMRFGPYFRRRFLRIYPPYLAAVAVSALVALAVPGFMDLPKLDPGRVAASALMVQNYTGFLPHALRMAPGQLPTNPALWSLPVEMELYLVYPLLLVLMRRMGEGRAVGITGAVSLLAAAGYVAGMGFLNGNFAKYWIIWSVGAWLAEKWARGELGPPPGWLGLAAAAALGISLYRDVRRFDSALTHFSYGLFYFWTVWSLLTRPACWTGIRRPISAGLAWLGRVSYSLYLLHFPLLCLLGALWLGTFGAKPVNFLIPIFACGLILPAVWLFYRAVELPSHRWAKRKRSGQKA